MSPSTFTKLYNHHHYLSPELCHLPKQKLCPIKHVMFGETKLSLHVYTVISGRSTGLVPTQYLVWLKWPMMFFYSTHTRKASPTCHVALTRWGLYSSLLFQFWSLGNDIWGLPRPHTRASLITQPSLFIIPLKECWRFLSHFSYHWGPLPKSVPLWATAPLHLRAAFDTKHMDNPQIIGNRVPSLVFHPGD